MKIALDHDGTYTADPALWDAFIKLATARGHEVTCVTMRHPHELISVPCPIVYTGRKAKGNHFTADIWIDDRPHWIFHDG